jgi:phosphoglycolate phosphatase-like HAD superfamily hydrolase
MRLGMTRLILFDIDGTLTRTQNGYLPFNAAIQKTFGVAGDIREVIPDGNTDPLIVEDIFSQAGARLEIDARGWIRFAEILGECYREAVRAGRTTIRPLPGALELVRALSGSSGFYPSVVTGNFEATAQIKLGAAGLALYLERGAYASDSHQRADLPRIAKMRWEEKSGTQIPAEQCVIVGDTPRDSAAARHNGMKCVLVGTGRYPVEELRCAMPDACLSDLRDTDAILEMLSRI